MVVHTQPHGPQPHSLHHSCCVHRSTAQLQHKNFLCSTLTSPSRSPLSNFLGNSAVAFPSLSPNKYHAKQDEYLLPRPSGMTHFLNQGRCNWALESWTPPKAGDFVTITARNRRNRKVISDQRAWGNYCSLPSYTLAFSWDTEATAPCTSTHLSSTALHSSKVTGPTPRVVAQAGTDTVP